MSIVGIPWGKPCFVIGWFNFSPFGKEAISRDETTQKEGIGTGAVGVVGNVIWFIVAGIWPAIGHVSSAVLNFKWIIIGGEGGIRTHGTLIRRTADFESAPLWPLRYLSVW